MTRRQAAGGRHKQERGIALPADVRWRRVSIVTPILEGWKIATGILAFITVQNLDEIVQAYRYLDERGGIAAAHVLYAGLVVAALLLIWALLGLASWWRRSYAVDADGVYLRTGLLFRQLRTARLPRIQSVDVVHPLLGRILGMGQLTVEVAGGKDSRVVIGFLRTRDLEALRERILDLAAGVADGPHNAAASPAGREAPGEGGVEAPGRIPRSREEHPLYAVQPGMLLASMARSGVVVGGLVFALASIGAAAVALITSEMASLSALGALMPALATPVGVITIVWRRFNNGWDFRAAATPSGIRMRYGLTSEISRTLPPGRVHAVKIGQPLLWRSKDWWRVEIVVAGREGSSEDNGQSAAIDVLLPVGQRATALRALWLVISDLGHADPDGLLASALDGMDEDGVGDRRAPVGEPGRGFVRVSPRGRVFSPIVWRREAIILTGTCVIVRTGRVRRRIIAVPYERIQSLRVLRGPMARRLGLASLKLDMVADDLSMWVGNLPAVDAYALVHEIAERSVMRRSQEHLDRWLQRAITVPGASDDPGASAAGRPAVASVAAPPAAGPPAAAAPTVGSSAAERTIAEPPAAGWPVAEPPAAGPAAAGWPVVESPDP
ncbi:PH domain-containing protein [Actinomyces slackii]|uniref:Bacterial membrane flanked domain n=1 Tax=Actinomyces slackii TaxID=52774 RepID=A0A448KBR2_9ACTO|nr:PH domain-containing protein [Actinomyces slackii]VEG74374.1 Bacterial membrane flanked domain [Actinomyces slackii]